MQTIFLTMILALFAAVAIAQRVPQGPTQLSITTQEATNAPAPVVPAATTNLGKNAKTSFLMDAGVQYTDEGEYREAEQAYLRALRDDPDNPDLRFRLGTLYVQMKQYDKAVEFLEKLSKEYPNHPGIHNNLAWIYATGEGIRNGKLALRHAREAILSAPTQASLWNTLAESYYVFGQYDKALSASECAIDLLKQQGASQKEVAEFEEQRAKILRGKEAVNRLMQLDGKEK